MRNVSCLLNIGQKKLRVKVMQLLNVGDAHKCKSGRETIRALAYDKESNRFVQSLAFEVSQQDRIRSLKLSTPYTFVNLGRAEKRSP